MFVCPSGFVYPFVCFCVWKLAPFPAVVSQIGSIKSCLVFVKSKNYAFWVTLGSLQPRRSMRWGRNGLQNSLQCFSNSPLPVPSSYMCSHTQDVLKKWVIPSHFQKHARQFNAERGEVELHIRSASAKKSYYFSVGCPDHRVVLFLRVLLHVIYSH